MEAVKGRSNKGSTKRFHRKKQLDKCDVIMAPERKVHCKFLSWWTCTNSQLYASVHTNTHTHRHMEDFNPKAHTYKHTHTRKHTRNLTHIQKLTPYTNTLAKTYTYIQNKDQRTRTKLCSARWPRSTLGILSFKSWWSKFYLN